MDLPLTDLLNAGDLAYTGASVIGITVIAALLILLGLWLRRREDEDDQK